MRIAHVRERHGPVGTSWRLAAALDDDGATWLDLDLARRRLVRRHAERAHNSALFRQPITTLDDLLAAGHRVAALKDVVDAFEPGGEDDDDAVLDAAHLAFGPPILRPPTLRDFYAFERHVATMWQRRGGEVPQAWYRLPIFYFGNVSEIRGPDEPVWAPRGSEELDFELEVGAVVDTGARDLERDETTVRLGPAKGKDFATTIGPWLVTPDELADARTPGATGPDLAMSADVDGQTISHGTWSSAQFSFGDMLARASADVRLRPGDLVGSGTVGSGCLLEVRDETLGRYLQPGDVVTLRIDRLGELRSPIVESPA